LGVHLVEAETALDEPVGVDAVAVELKAGVVEDKVHAAALLGSVTEEDIKKLQSTGGDHLAATEQNILGNDLGKVWELAQKVTLTLMRRDKSVELPHRQI
jgi:hypothetical protein